MKHLYFFLLLLPFQLSAQYSYKVFDLHSGTYGNGFHYGSYPENFTVFNNKVYFTARDSAHGHELMVCDGNKVSLVTDISNSFTSTFSGNPSNILTQLYTMTGEINLLFFVARDSTDYYHIYKYDEKNKPTIAVEIGNTSINNRILQLSSVYDTLYFLYKKYDSVSKKHDQYIGAYNNISGSWNNIVDSNINIDEQSPLYSWNNKLYFSAFDSSIGTELYTYDPQTGIAQLAAETIPGPKGSDIQEMSHTKDNLYFIVKYDNGTPKHIGEYDGNGNLNIITLNPAINMQVRFNHRYGKAYTIYNDKVYFIGGHNSSGLGLFEYNPSNGIISLIENTKGSSQHYVRGFGNNLLYTGTHIWKYDFTTPGVKLQDLSNHPLPFNMLHLNGSIEHNNSLYCNAALKSYTDEELVIIFDSTLSIQNQPIPLVNLTAYPNPVTGHTHLSFSIEQPQTLSVTLTNINGQVVYSKEGELYSTGKHQLTIPMQELPTGSYIYTVRDKNGTMTNSGKLLKQ